MRNIPMFTTEFGVASLTLREIPYTGKAYITVHDASDPEAFVSECANFCAAAGANQIFATGEKVPESCEHYTDIWQMQCIQESLPDTDAALFPVQEETMSKWREVYNSRMQDVPNASWLTADDAEALLQKGSAYFIHRGDQLLGIGIAAGETIDAVISLKRGAGHDIVLALNHALSGQTIRLTVASANEPAVRLYEKLGFLRTAVLSKWYRVSQLP